MRGRCADRYVKYAGARLYKKYRVHEKDGAAPPVAAGQRDRLWHMMRRYIRGWPQRGGKWHGLYAWPRVVQSWRPSGADAARRRRSSAARAGFEPDRRARELHGSCAAPARRAWADFERRRTDVGVRVLVLSEGRRHACLARGARHPDPLQRFVAPEAFGGDPRAFLLSHLSGASPSGGEGKGWCG